MAWVCGPSFAGLLGFMWKSVHLAGGQEQPPNWLMRGQFGRVNSFRGCETNKKKAKSKAPHFHKPKAWATQNILKNKPAPPVLTFGFPYPAPMVFAFASSPILRGIEPCSLSDDYPNHSPCRT